MLFPNKVKYRKWQRMREHPEKAKARVTQRGGQLNFGTYGMKALDPARIRSNQIEATRRVLSRKVGKLGRIWIRIFPDRPWTQKAAEVGMGKGKGDPQGFEIQVYPGRVLFELSGVNRELARSAIISAGKKLPVRVKFVEKIER